MVGRTTGAGKSSLISSLFRLFSEDLEDEIKMSMIVETSMVGLSELRCNISIPSIGTVFFSESLCYNLDSFNQHDESLEVVESVAASRTELCHTTTIFSLAIITSVSVRGNSYTLPESF